MMRRQLSASTSKTMSVSINATWEYSVIRQTSVSLCGILAELYHPYRLNTV